jgi:hypothetical protein
MMHGNNLFMLFCLLSFGMLAQGCVSLEVSGPDGKPRLIGCGSTQKIQCARGQLYQLNALGLCIRTEPFARGISLGWHQVRLFYPASKTLTDPVCEPLAIQTRCAGFDVALFSLMAGIEEKFAILPPDKREAVTQCIIFSSSNITNSIIERKESK